MTDAPVPRSTKVSPGVFFSGRKRLCIVSEAGKLGALWNPALPPGARRGLAGRGQGRRGAGAGAARARGLRGARAAALAGGLRSGAGSSGCLHGLKVTTKLRRVKWFLSC